MGALEMLASGVNSQYDPAQGPATQPAPGANPGNPAGADPNDDPCKNPREKRFRYQPMEAGKRPSGVTALICPADLKATGSQRDDGAKVHVAGFPVGSNLDENDKPIYNRAHILGDRFHGSWRSENLFTGYARMNTSGMKRCENRMAKAETGTWVEYSGQLRYKDSDKLIPEGITMTAKTKTGPLFNVYIKNIPEFQVSC
ncbi:DNA/RNA non-specific endonuclease [Streptomyces thermolilacinus]|uniref:DNA/RNA non-specific endonuclease n=1 Tax=Streptomyces thermolilacinus TaxID=285540 RepID=UPI00099F6784|nr:DNA/RNA non-specific endonuclease [Streptomyces thermolilacinus]